MKKVMLVNVLISVLLTGCHKSSTDPGSPGEQIKTYPTGIGSNWSFQHIMRTENFRPSFHGATYTPDTVQGTVTVAVTRFLRLPSGTGRPRDSIQTSEFQRTEVVSEPYPSTSVGYQYYTCDSSGLYMHGYGGAGGMFTPAAVPEGPHFVLNGMSFRSIQEMSDIVQGLTNRMYADTILREIPPRKVLQFPLSLGDSWVYLAGNPFRIEKTVLSDTTLVIGAGSFHCFKVHWLYDLNNDGIPDANIFFDDYIADEGLLRRTIYFKDIRIATTEYPDGIGVVDSWDEYIGVSVIAH